jgi:serine/threonine-protein kinase
MSPEQARGLRVDPRTDLWALGVIAFRCMVGRLPFQSDSLGDLFAKIITDPIPVPSQLLGPGGVPPGFDAWWARSSARDADQRFQSAKEMADALSLALGVSLTSNSAVDLRPPLGLPPPPPIMAAASGPLTPGPISSPGAHGTVVLTSGSGGGHAQISGQTPTAGWSPQTAGAVAAEVPRPAKRSLALPIAAAVVGALALGGTSFVALRAGGGGSPAATTTATATADAVPTIAPSAPAPAVTPAAPTPSASAAPSVVPPAPPRSTAAPALPQTAHPSPAPASTTRAKVMKPVHDDGI